jgi:uncharacterized protein YjeT (DUF2065 family)
MPIPSWLTTDSRRKELSGVCFKVPKNGLLLVGNKGVAMPVAMTTVEVAVVYCTGIATPLFPTSKKPFLGTLKQTPDSSLRLLSVVNQLGIGILIPHKEATLQ